MRACVWIALLLQVACAQTDTATWTEEVKSHDGRTFALEGRAERYKSGLPLSHRGSIRYVSYRHRESGAYWKSDGRYIPAAFELVDGRPYVLVPVASEDQCVWHGFPKSSSLVFRWDGKGWAPATIDELPIDRMERNLLRRIFDERDQAKDAEGLVSIDQKRLRDPDQRTLGSFLAQVGPYCAGIQQQIRDGLKISTRDRPAKLDGSHEGR